ncbi:MAG: formate dehydrogenase subunit alpha [Omnitrophica bacterium]|nr:formate dehydrogenase subunit alpha [Candidatus Omnitrophota bacterium]
MITVTINGKKIQAKEGQTIMEAAVANGISIPHLCHEKRLAPVGACRLCQVEVNREPVLACSTKVASGLTILTESKELTSRRRSVLELLLSEHKVACTTCDADGDCKLQDYAYRYGADEFLFGSYQRKDEPILNYTSANLGIEHDSEKCIRCGRCVRYCREVQGVTALTFDGRGIEMKINTAHGRDLHASDCELCGGCIRVCPTGAMREKGAKGLGRKKDLVKTQTTCTYCGVGCQLELNVNPKTNKVVRVTTRPGMGLNDGNLCGKGHFSYDFISSPERLTKPLIRANGTFRQATWEEAISLSAKKLRKIRDNYGPQSIAFLSSCRCTNEENYLMQKLARTAGGTNNIDQCATTCHAPTIAGLASAFGSGAMTNSVAEIKDCKVLFIIGSNPTEAHPIVGLEMKKAMARGAKLIVCDPRSTWMAERADIHIKHRPGSDNMLINALMNFIIKEKLHDEKFVQERCENFEAFADNLKPYSIKRAAEYCGVSREDIKDAARIYSEGQPSAIFYTLGITEHSCGTDNVKNLANLAMLSGQIGKWASGVNPLRGQNNVQGACDMCAMPHRLPGYQKLNDPKVREKFEKAWGVPLPTNEGGRVTHFIEGAGSGELRGFYVMGEDPVMSEPNQSKVVKHLKQLDFLVCQEIFMSETAKLAHVILPGACYAEKDGTFTASERRVQRIRKAVKAPGVSRADWQIICDISTAMGYPMKYSNPSDIFNEMASLNPSYAGMDYGRIEKNGLQWPCPDKDHCGTVFLHKGDFKRGKGLFQPIVFQPQKEEPDKKYPLILSTGRTLYHYNVGNMTRKSGISNQKEKECFVEINSATADKHGILDGNQIKVITRRGSISAVAKVSRRVREDSIWMPFHFVEASANILTNDVFDPVTATAEYKCCAARLEVGAGL